MWFFQIPVHAMKAIEELYYIIKINFKACVRYFYQIFIFHHMIALQKLWKTFSFLRYLRFCIFIFPSFFPVSYCFRGWSKKNLKIYDVINCLNKNLITHFVWYLKKEIRCDIETLFIDRELNKEHFYAKASPRPLFAK